MKRSLILTLAILLSGGAWAQSVTISESAGWLETAYTKWLPVEGAESYNVYYSGEGNTNVKINDQLIRSYGTYFRADIPGLKAGSYTIKVAPVISNVEGTASETASISVQAHDRTGFAFSNGRVPGAYKADGTPKAGAVVLYITQSTKNTVSLDVSSANSNPCVGLQTILDGFKKGYDNRPLIVRMIGQITDFSYMLGGDLVIENKNNSSSYITLEGIGDDATADGWGIRVKNATNIEIRNIGTMNCNSSEGDNIGLQQNNTYVWVHHVDFFYGDAGGDSDQAKGDGALDSKTSGYVTFSYNHFWDTGKSNLLGNGTEAPQYLSYHHNWYDHSDSRHPRVRSHSVHVYNNYFDGISKYGVGSTKASSIFVEANYFRNCKYPMLISEQGTDVFGSNDGTFSGENGGIIKAYNNYMIGQTRFAPYGDADYPNSTVDFDAYVATTRNETVGSGVTTFKGGTTYNNFDTNASLMYSYTPESPEGAKEKVMQYAGRMNGGDFDWTFDNAVDDASYAVNTALKSALSNYQTSLVSVQGDGSGNGGDTGGDDGGDTGGDTGGGNNGDVVHNFTVDGETSSFFSISGSFSTSKGDVNYNGLTLTKCLKIESATNVSFTTSQESTLVLVFNEGYANGIKVDGTTRAVTNGVLTLTIATGSHQITKADVANLYYISITYPNTAITWNGVWSNGSGPTASDNALISSNFTGAFTCADLTVASGFTLEVNGLLDVKGDLINGGSILILSGSTLLTYEGKSVDAVTIQRNTRYADGKYSFVGSPTAQNPNTIGGNLGSHVYRYDESIANGNNDGLSRWVTASSDELVAGKGYTQAFQKEVSFFGIPNAGTITYSGTYTEDSDNSYEGWNLVANPYAAAINISQFVAANTNIVGSVYIWDDNDSQASRGSNADYIVANGIAATQNSTAGNSARYHQHLGSAQGFFVKILNNTNTDIVFTEAMRADGDNEDDHFFRKSSDGTSFIRLNMTNANGLFKQAIVGMVDDASAIFINRLYDAPVFNPNAENALFTLKNNQALAIQGVNPNQTEISLGLNVAQSGVYSLQLDDTNYNGSILYLQDKLTGKIVELSSEPYSFSSIAGQFIDRFVLLTASKVLANETALISNMYVYDKTLHLNMTESKPIELSVWSLSGKRMMTISVNGSAKVDLEHLPYGIYMIGDGQNAKKIILR